MTDLETLWRDKSDEEVLDAARHLGEYRLEAQFVIRQELARRQIRLPESWECSNCHEKVEDSFDACWKCGRSKDGLEQRFSAADSATLEGLRGDVPDGIILATTPSLESHTVVRYLGVVFGEAIVGAGIFNDFLASVTELVGGRSASYESPLADARRTALADMARRAKDLGANAILAIDVDYETIRDTMIIVTCCGTAVEVSSASRELA